MKMNAMTDNFVMNNGVKIPCIGYGTYQTPDEEICVAMLEAIKAGYRHIDTAALYGNEKGVGKAVKECGIPREELFITSKVWNDCRGYDKAKAAFEESMKKLDMEYLDLLLIHWPANKKQYGEEAKSLNAETWRAFEELYNAGKVKAIGLSNFLPHHIEELMETATIKPMVNQIEFHPGWAQLEVAKYCQENDIVVEAWSPFGRKDIIENETLKEIGKKYGKSVAQVCMNWILNHGILPLPKSVTPSRMVENTLVFDFKLSQEDMDVIDALKDLGGQCAMPDEVDF